MPCAECGRYIKGDIPKLSQTSSGKFFYSWHYKNERGQLIIEGCPVYDECRGLQKGPILFMRKKISNE